MKRSRFSDRQIAFGLRHTEGGTAVADLCELTDTGGGKSKPGDTWLVPEAGPWVMKN
jgi:hypothetical protein